MPKKTSVLIAGESGTGKSYFTATLVWAIASGGSCFGWQASNSMKVGIFDGELRDSKIQERLKIVASCVQKNTADITIVSRDKYTAENLPFPDLTDAKQARSVLDMFSGVDVLVVDNVHCCFSGRDENSSGFWQSVQEFTLLCRERGITLIVVHHCPKSNPNKPAGNSKNERIFEKVIVLSKILAPARLPGAHFNVHFDKDRDCSDDTEDFSARLVKRADGLYQWEVRDFINQ